MRKAMMSIDDKKPVLGIITDEDAMYDLLAKFLVKEGYEVGRVTNRSYDDEYVLIVYAPTRESTHSRTQLDELVRRKRAVVVVQCCDEDYVDLDPSVAVISDRPLNLRQLSSMIGRTIESYNPKFSHSTKGEMKSQGVAK